MAMPATRTVAARLATVFQGSGCDFSRSIRAARPGSVGPASVGPASAGIFWSGFDSAGCDGLDQLGVVPLVLVGVGLGEPAHRGAERSPFAEVAVDGHRITGAGVRSGQDLTARGTEHVEPGRDQLRFGNDLHVAELPHVVVPAVQRT